VLKHRADTRIYVLMHVVVKIISTRLARSKDCASP